MVCRALRIQRSDLLSLLRCDPALYCQPLLQVFDLLPVLYDVLPLCAKALVVH
jgi:hypothetical protein